LFLFINKLMKPAHLVNIWGWVFLFYVPYSSVHVVYRTVYTDNSQTFQAANREVRELCDVLSAAKAHQYFHEHRIRWKLIAPQAAWWGGWWERMNATTKRCLRKVLGCSQDAGLQTILVGIAASLNLRPIIQDENETLIPDHFLTGGRLIAILQGPEPVLT
jgi:hypothetical protein